MLHLGPNNNEVEEKNNNNLASTSDLTSLKKPRQDMSTVAQPPNYYYDVWTPNEDVGLPENNQQATMVASQSTAEQGAENAYFDQNQRNVLDAFSGYSEYFGEQNMVISASGLPQVDYYSQTGGHDMNSNYYPYFHHPSLPHPNYNNNHSYYMRHHQYSPIPPQQATGNAGSSPLEEYLDLSMPIRNSNLDPPYYQFQEEAQSLAAITPLSFKLSANNASAYSAENNCYESPGLPHYGHVRPSDVINPDLYHAIHNPVISPPSYSNSSSFPFTSPTTSKRRKPSVTRKRGNNQAISDGVEGTYLSPSSHIGGSNPPVVFGPNGEVYQKPPYSYAALISRALRECDGGKLTLSGIYEWIKDQFPYYRTAEAAWQVKTISLTSFCRTLSATIFH